MPIDASGPRVTIGIPVRNGARYLEESLASVRAQTVTDLRIVITDNASDDDTPRIAQAAAAADERITYVRHPRDLGLAGNFNSLVDLARTPLFKWVAADDVIAPTYVEACLRVFDATPALSVVACRLQVVDSQGQLFQATSTGRLVSSEGFDIPIRRPIAQDMGAADPGRRFRAALSGMLGLEISTYIFGLMRTDALRRTSSLGSYPGSDKVLLAELALQGAFAEVPEILWSCRIHPTHVGGQTPAEVRRAMRPSWRTRIESMRLDQLKGYVAAVAHADMGVGPKMWCLAAVGRRGMTAAAGQGE